MRDRVDGLGSDVPTRAGERGREHRVGLGELEHLLRAAAVAESDGIRALRRGLRAQERQPFRCRRSRRAEVQGSCVDGVPRHHAVGRVLAAGDRGQDPEGARRADARAREPRRVSGAARRDERAKASEDAVDLRRLHGPRQDAVDFGEQVLDVAPVGHGPVDLTSCPLGVGIAQKPVVRAPRNCVEDALLRTHEEARSHRDGRARNNQVHAFRGSQGALRATGGELEQFVRSPTPTATIVCRARSSRGRPASEWFAPALRRSGPSLPGGSQRLEPSSRSTRRGRRQCGPRRRRRAHHPPGRRRNCTAPTSESGRSAGAAASAERWERCRARGRCGPAQVS